ncbi:MAG: peptidoglycan-binding domain-containing protein [Candidatus Omnitrophota bacterium]|nr:peptidoglycan-binding domain-containing protein [Candidatus Omnitrophota bacterium]
MQGKAGLLIAGLCGALVLTSFGYGMGRRAALKSVASSMGVTPAGSPLPAIQIEPIQPQEELAAINSDAAENLPAPAQVASTPPVEAVAAATDETARVQQIQLALKAAGFDPGSSDGKLGPRTKTAVRDFQQANGLNPDGKVGSRTWSKLEPYLKTAQAAAPATQGQGD